MSELETRRAAAAAGEPHPDLVRTAELIQYEDAELDAAELEAADLGTLDADGADAADADLLAIPPRADDLGTALAARPPRLKLPKVTLALAGAALICAGFVGGVLVQKHLGGSSSSGRGNFAAAFTGGRTGTGTTGRTGTGTGAGTGATGGFFGRGGTGAAGGGAITGTVTVVSGNKLYVTAADGSVYTVTTSGSTVINVTKSGALSQLKPGQTVIIAGANDNSGDVTATSITASSSSSTSGTNTTGGQ